MILLLNYILEIKNRILLLLFTWCTVFIMCYNYKEIMLYIIIKPSFNNNLLCNFSKVYFITTNVTEIFTTYINIANIFSNKICLLFFLIHCIIFIKKGLYQNEINIIKKICIIYTVLSFFSIMLLYYIIIPFSWNFFFNFQEIIFTNQLNVYFESKLSEYLTFYRNLQEISNLLCQIFTCIFIYINNIKNYLKIIKKYKKFTYFFLFLITTLVTPPDVFSQIILGSILITSYEIFIIIILYLNYINKVIH
jgi:sec-independent protein translocase protein TatC